MLLKQMEAEMAQSKKNPAPHTIETSLHFSDAQLAPRF